MESADEPRSLQDLIRRRQARTFVGRQREVVKFGHNLAAGLDDPGRRVIFAIDGPAGVGKSYLMQRFSLMARDEGSVAAISDSDPDDIVSLIERLAKQLDRENHFFDKLDRKIRDYTSRRAALLNDTRAPDGLGPFLLSAGVRLSIAVARVIPPVSTVAEALDPADVAQQAEQMRAYIARRFRKSDDYSLLINPVPILTEAFLQGLRNLAIDVPNVSLGVDTFDSSSPWVQQWLVELLGDSYGPLPPNLVLVIAGQRPLNPNQWSQFSAVTESISLSPFTQEETEELLRMRGIGDRGLAKAVMLATDGLPVLVDLLTQNSLGPSTELPDATEPAVERFLQNELDDRRRKQIITIAAARRITPEVVRELFPPPEQDPFPWIADLPFVRKSGNSWTFHEVVRGFLVRYSRDRSPEAAALAHLIIAQVHIKHLVNDHAVASGPIPHSEQDHEVELVYQVLCGSLHGDIANISLRSCIIASDSRARSRRIAQAVIDAGKDSSDARIAALGKQLADAVEDGRGGAPAYYSALIDSNLLNNENLALALRGRARANLSSHRPQEALDDIEKSIALIPTPEKTRLRATYLSALARPQESLAALDALPTLQSDAATEVVRAQALYRLNQYEAAIDAITRAIAAEPASAQHRMQRARIYEATGNWNAALFDLSEAISIEPSMGARRARAYLYRITQRYDDALADLNTMLESEMVAEDLVRRAEVLRILGRPGDGLEDAQRGAASESMYGWATFSLGLTFLAMDRPTDADRYLRRALTIGDGYLEREPTSVPAVFNSAMFSAAGGSIHRSSQLLSRLQRLSLSTTRRREAATLIAEIRQIGINVPESALDLEDGSSAP